MNINNKQRPFISILCNALLILGIFALAILCSHPRKVAEHSKAGASPSSYTTVDVAYADGRTAHFNGYTFGSVSIGDVVTIRLNMPNESPITVDATMVFSTYSASRYIPFFSWIPLMGILSVGFLLLLIYMAGAFMYSQLMKEAEQKSKNVLLERQNQAYAHELALVQEKSQAVRTLRHDLKNHALVVRNMVHMGENESAEKYIDQFFAALNEAKPLATSGCTALDSILNYKLQAAAEIGAKIDLTLRTPAEINVDVLDLNSILGNLLDNAIDGMQRSAEKRLYIDVHMNKEVFYVGVKNTFDGVINPDERISGAYKTRKQDTQMHGLGLASIQRTIEKYHGTMKAEHDNHMFSVRILLYPHYSAADDGRDQL